MDTDKFYPAPSAGDKKELTFLLIARVIRHKGIYEFIRAAGILKQKGIPVRCQLLGFFDEGSPIAISRQQVEEWQRQNLVDYLGDTDDVAPFIAKADCIVLPSYREGMPLSLLEGASMCKPLIATDTPGCRDVIQDGVNGYLCKEKDGADLADKMEKLYRLSPGERSDMGQAGRQLVRQHFARDIIANIYLDKIKALTSTR